MANIKFKLSLFILTLLIFNAENAKSMEFSDIPQGFWAYRQIDKLTDENIISGYPNNKFLPSKYVTRAEYASMVIKAAEQENIPVDVMYSFEDINVNHWAWNYIIRAVNLDIIKPAGGRYFYPDDYVTRSDVITFLVNILKSEDITKKEALNALRNAYDDFDDIPDWFKVTAGKAEVLNVIAKKPERQRYLDYDKYATRAEMSVFLYNFKQTIEKYRQEKIKEAVTPKKGGGIVIENVLYDDDVAEIPAKTVLPIAVAGGISSKDSVEGSMFRAKFANNIVDYEHNILLSKDTILIGKILDINKAKYFVKNGSLLFELSAANKNNNYTRIMGVAECEPFNDEYNKITKTAKALIKGKDFTAKDDQILYVKLFKPIRVNIVTGEILD